MFKELDFMNLDSLLTPEELQIKDSVRKFVSNEYMPTVSENFEKGHFDKTIIPKLGAMGLLGPTLPEKYGGANLSNISYGIINQELERGDSGLRSFASVQNSLLSMVSKQYLMIHF
jgi:glutaryl-CoA dehydrogenase